MSFEGVFNIDKPQGITSHDAVNRLRRLSGIRRVGHAGTLDPLATGVLIICIGRATRLVEYLIGLPKEYEAIIRLGQVTDSYDADGALVSEQDITVSGSDIKKSLAKFRGRIQQRAPIYSAIKKQGVPLYKLARDGVSVKAPVREVEIYELAIVSWEKPNLEIKVRCAAGTYIRSLAHDLGQELGCGGHITSLTRTSVGNFRLSNAVSLDDLHDENWSDYSLPADIAVQHLPRLDLRADEAHRVQLGQRIGRLDIHPEASIVRAYEQNGRFIGILSATESAWQPHKMFLVDS
ncbi:MAG: tRNA pseudouridine(55) synthase TruB [Candidatus Promineifilaceae bacterium]|nr:tRNA pseudouridine(55) synthase TruB [Candidatus Promineifilaceae bacterium]